MGSPDSLHETLNGAGEHFALHLETDDVERGAQLLVAIGERAADLAAAPGATRPRISAPGPLPDGIVLRIDDLSNRVDTRRTLAEAIRAEAARYDLEDAGLAVLPVDGLSDLDRCRRAVVLRIFPTPAGAAGRLDPAWIDVAAEWVFGDQAPDASVRLRVLGVERSVRAADAPGVLHGCASAHVWCDVVTGDVESRVRTASISFGAAPHVAIAGGGPRCDDDGLLARFDLLREVVRELAHDCAYACLDFEASFGDLGTGLSHTDWALEGGASPNTVAGLLCDRFVPDVFAHQLLGPGHLARLQAVDPDRSWGTPVDDDRIEVTIGEPVDWLTTSEVRPDIRADGWDILDPLLLQGDQLADELEALARVDPDPQVQNGSATVGRGVPQLDAIIIDAERHTRRGTRLTVLELAAWLAGEPHTDSPASVSPVLQVFLRQLGLGLDDGRRQLLKQLAARVIGTGREGPDAEQRRALRLADWLVRGHAPPWLRRAGLTESADRLDGLGSIADNNELVRAVDLLGNAIITAGRRLEITTAIAGDNASLVDEIAWNVWELAAERSGWIAATEAVLHEIPADLAFAADQRVIECSRDPRVRAELESTTRGLGDAIWSAALHEIAAAAWRGAWEAAEGFVHHESTFSLGTALRRSLEDELGPEEDEVTIEGLLEEVDLEARDALAQLVLTREEEPAFWKRAIDAASTGPDGASWRRALDRTRDLLGVTLFDDALEVARAELHRWLDRSPQLVGRVVAAAVAREASGVAARAVAARAAAEQLARDATASDAEAVAYDTIAPIVHALADDALRMAGHLTQAEDSSG